MTAERKSWLTDDDRVAIAARVRAKRIAQGLPPYITDVVALGRLADRAAAARARRDSAERSAA